MKLKYKKPNISIETLDRSDVLLSSVATPAESEPVQKSEIENSYGDFVSFALDPKNWFD